MNAPRPSGVLGRARLEILVLGIVFVAATALFGSVVYPALGWPQSAPMPGRSILIAVAILILQRYRNEPFAALGLKRPRHIWLAVLAALAFVAFHLFALQPLADWLRPAVGAPRTDYTLFAHIEGNVPAYIGWLAIAWISGGFSEELIFRGYLIARFSALGGNTSWSLTFAILLQAALFGAAHLYLGPGTAMTTGITALASGVFYLLVGRNLWPLVIAHGLWDSLGFTVFFLQGVPE